MSQLTEAERVRIALVQQVALIECDTQLASFITKETSKVLDDYDRYVRGPQMLTCAFCGEEYPPGTPPTQHARLTAHVKVCTKHPMRDVEKERDEARAQNAAYVAAWEEFARWPELPGVPFGATLVDPATGETKEYALRPEQITGLTRALEKHVRTLLPFGVGAVRSHQDIEPLRASLGMCRNLLREVKKHILAGWETPKTKEDAALLAKVDEVLR